MKRKIQSCLMLTLLFIVNLSIIINPNDINEEPPIIDEHLEFSDDVISISPQKADSGKVYDTITRSQGCSINNFQPSFNIQPSIYIPDSNLSNADMMFSNIVAENYTFDLESESTEFFISASVTKPTYIFQKFWVEISQYINNVSIFIQDINSPSVFNANNSWEVAITNCTNDGKPNATLGSLLKPHPFTFAAHWEEFDFLNFGDGPIYLNVSETNSTFEDGITKYWFAMRVKVPPYDDYYGGGPKFLYFNPDGGDLSNKGVGDTYAIFPDNAKYKNYTVAYIVNYSDTFSEMNGTRLQGDLNSFKNGTDEDRFIVQSDTDNLTIYTRFDLGEDPVNFTLWNWYRQYDPAGWALWHSYAFYGLDMYLTTNITDIADIDTATMYILNYTDLSWVNISDAFDIYQENETTIHIEIRDQATKDSIMSQMNISDGHSIADFKFVYNSTGGTSFNVSINEFRINLVLLEDLDPIQQFDPGIQELTYPVNVDIINGSAKGNPSLESLRLNDNDYYTAESHSNNLSIEFEFNILPYLDNSSWSMDMFDFEYIYPNPIIPIMELRLSSNVSISTPINLTSASLELYKGDIRLSWARELDNVSWIPVSGERDLAFPTEAQLISPLPANVTWLILQFVNTSNSNSLRWRLRYAWNETLGPIQGTFNVSIDEFSFNIYVQNVVSSDITSKIGFALNSYELSPSDINMQNFGTSIVDAVGNSGTWVSDIADGAPVQGYFEFNITSIWPLLTFDVTGDYEIYQIKPKLEFIDNPETQYMTGKYVFSVKATSYNGNPIEGFQIIFEVLDANEKVISEKTAFTNEKGIASASLDLEETGDGLSIRAKFEGEGIFIDSEATSTKFNVDNEFTRILDYIIEYSMYIAIVLAGLFGYLAINHSKKKKLRARWADDALLFEDILKISHILIIHKEVGVAIYNQQVSSETLDSDLISGFLQAISQFKKEFKKERAQRGFEMDYGDFKILMNDGQYIRVALIVEGSPSEKLSENQNEFTKHFERRFGNELANFTGDLKPYRNIDDIIEKYFNITLMYPLQLGRMKDVLKLKALDKALLEVAEQIEKEKRFFFISSLLNFATAGRKESKDQIISTIISLKERGIIVPAKME